MALTDRFGVVADCWIPSTNETNFSQRDEANRRLFNQIRNSDIFPKDAFILDLGCGDEGSWFPKEYQKQFPSSRVIYLDNFLGFLGRLGGDIKVCGDGTELPFKTKSLDLIFAGYLLHEGVIRDSRFRNDETYRIVAEAYRVLRQDGLFLFTCGESGDDINTTRNLAEIGFHNLTHIQRLKFYRGSPTDMYFTIK